MRGFWVGRGEEKGESVSSDIRVLTEAISSSIFLAFWEFGGRRDLVV